MCQYAKGVVTTYQPISFSVTSLHPYQAMVIYQDMKAASDWFRHQFFLSWINTSSKGNGNNDKFFISKANYS